MFFGAVLGSVGARGKFWDTAESGCRGAPKGLRAVVPLLLPSNETKIPLGSEISLEYLTLAGGDLGDVGGTILTGKMSARGGMAGLFLVWTGAGGINGVNINDDGN